MIRKTTVGDASGLRWFKSSYSDGTQGDSCVEIATTPGTVHIRDSKSLKGPHLTLAPNAWADFITYTAQS
ncbi:DUF397 domain-containing protein [Streptomyces paludis]|uniref:DUF397 domain-containing protein n=1 Tax=Streptomyces paludis TaxID=2282738 RepID=A0A345HQ05_9ACTN|nr:DUF397 domain-containing protein [Streptomyces paludis]AXG78779.1 DUF397 domain-containing protein [Streptomyces paludis]